METTAIDVGFGRVKSVTERGEVDFPSVIGDFHPVSYKVEDNKDHTVVQMNGTPFFVGEIARRQSIPRSTLDAERIVGTEGLTLLYASLSKMYKPGKHYINLVTGLPVNDFDTLKEKYKNILQQSRMYFKTLTIDGEINGNYVFHINNSMIIPQPMGSLFDKLLDNNGEIKHKDYALQQVGVIDIGFHTLDLLRADNLEYIDRSSDSFRDLGLFSAFEEVRKELYKDFQIEIPLEKIEPIIYKNGHITIKGKKESISTTKQKAFDQAADRIISRVKNTWKNLWEIDKLIITGGGATLLGEQIVNKLNHHGTEICNNDNIYTNVKGYYKFGVRSWKG